MVYNILITILNICSSSTNNFISQRLNQMGLFSWVLKIWAIFIKLKQTIILDFWILIIERKNERIKWFNSIQYIRCEWEENNLRVCYWDI